MAAGIGQFIQTEQPNHYSDLFHCLGTAFICTLFSIQSILLNRVNLSASGNQPNTVLFDIQSAQKDKVLSLAKQNGLPVNGTVPIVNMRLESINNITAETLAKDSTIENDSSFKL